ncbi:hypothetical protein [Ulvibacter litoralis]|uniref:Uncharacterized protein n=1 Tax=Ulvibacter litoralis TaxID=227084 RepID=A0A1G7D3T9_9FLAO|nr:hypothetical protein [Ulvibacter litoralis]GHC45228.1 hypothetical protein GCM10008083_04950 [Ulvibacter litoralis]SDE45395.1 hypothetical protein SAMN05421855_101706 [Ulvibacter litoralis]
MKFLKSISIVVLLITALSCSKETEETFFDEPLEATVTQNRGGDSRELLLIWRKGLSNADKHAIRTRYMEIKFLKDWYVCENEDVETWEFYCGEEGVWCQGKESDTPVETGDDVQRIALDMTCADIE